MVQELRLRNAAANIKIGLCKLSEILKENEHPQWKERQNSMSDDEIHDAKFFSPQCLSANQWDKDNISTNNS